ncbi:hypothetical protein WME95_00370 [Sorangium sp. So ce327]|jgi:hypothetical protein|uniref:hypothetical protein n=1 Tax=unclassified Sorangium TaxID=2621164 RepID=UPI003F5E5811
MPLPLDVNYGWADRSSRWSAPSTEGTGDPFCGSVLSFGNGERPAPWSTRFMGDSEFNRPHAPPPLEDA